MVGVLLLLCLATTARASELTARVDQDHLSLGESLQLVVQLTSDHGGLTSPDMDFDLGSDFDVLGQASSQNVQWINGRTSISRSITYRLQPTHAGRLTIPALTLDYRGEHLTTEPIAVTVAAAPPPPSQPLAISSLP